MSMTNGSFRGAVGTPWGYGGSATNKQKKGFSPLPEGFFLWTLVPESLLACQKQHKKAPSK